MEKLKILNSIVPGYSERFTKGQYGFEEMPLLDALCARFGEQTLPDLQNTYIVACQHLLEPQLKMFRWFIRLGIPSAHIYILPKVYSANPSILKELSELGCTINTKALEFSPEQSFDDFQNQQCDEVVLTTVGTIPTGSKLIVLDDGGMLLASFAKQIDSLTKKQINVYGVEQTASGKNMLLSKQLPFIITSVASSVEKIEIETGYIIRHAVSRVFDYFNEHAISSNAKILILGMGPVGKTLIESLRRHGFICSGYDIAEGVRRPNLAAFDVVIGATGKQSLSIDDLSRLKSNSHLVSVSSSDREFPSVHIRTHSISGSQVHDTFVYKEKGIHLANGGFPITFKAERIECYPVEMDVTMMKLAEGVLKHACATPEFDDTIQQLFLNKKAWMAYVSLYALMLMATSIGILNFTYHLYVPGSLKSCMFAFLILFPSTVLSVYYLRLFYKFTKLLPG